MKNGTTLMLKKNANLLKEFYSGVDDENGNLVDTRFSEAEQELIRKKLKEIESVVENEMLNVFQMQEMKMI